MKMSSSSSSTAQTSPNILLLILCSTPTLASKSDFTLTPQWKPVNTTHLALSATIPGEMWWKSIAWYLVIYPLQFLQKSGLPKQVPSTVPVIFEGHILQCSNASKIQAISLSRNNKFITRWYFIYLFMQSVFFSSLVPPKKLKYGKPRLGESTA